MPEAELHVTITYPDFVTADSKRLKADWNSLRRFFPRHGVCGLWVLEIGNHGRPHWHVITSTSFDMLSLKRLWMRRMGLRCDVRGYRGIHAARIYNLQGLAQYLSKTTQKPSNDLGIGKWWDRFGKWDAKPILEFTGPAEDLTEAREEIFIRRPRYKSPRTESGELPDRFTARGAASSVARALVNMGLTPSIS